MDQRSRIIIVIAIAVLVLAAVLGVVYFFNKYSRGITNPAERSALDSLTRTRTSPVPTLPSSTGSNTISSNGNKTYFGAGFNVIYPENWGLLTCSNSKNFELDPTSSSDVKNVVCDRAVKPVTVLLSDSQPNCQGQTTKIGAFDVIKSKVTPTNGDTNYRWCFKAGSKWLDITHRVSASGSRATSPTDFSSQIEQLITNLQIAAGS